MTTVTHTFLALGSGEVLARVFSFAGLVYLAQVLGVEAFGALELASAIVIYGNRIVDLGFDLGLGVREIAAGDAERRARILSVGLLSRSAMAVLVIGALAGGGLLWLPELEGRVLAIYAFTLLGAGLGTRWLHLGFERSRLVAVARILGELSMLAIVLLFVHTEEDLLRAPVARVASEVVTATILLFGAVRLVRPHRGFDTGLLRNLVSRSTPLVAAALFGLMIFNADLIFLRTFEGRAAVGLYAAAYTLIAFLSNLGTSYSLSLLPTLTGLAGDPEARDDLYGSAHVRVALFGFAVATGGTLLAGPLIRLVFGPEYADAALPLAILLWSVPLALLRDMPVTALMSVGDERPIYVTTGQAAALNVLLNFLLVPRFGMAGAAVATVLTELTRWGLLHRAARTTRLSPPPVSRYGKALVAAGAMAAGLLLVRDAALWISIPVGGTVWIAALVALRVIRAGSDGVGLDV